MHDSGTTAFGRRRWLYPARRIFLGFVALNLAGWGLLMLPISRTADGAATWLEALFTAVSAACVTGLTVVDTAVYWTPFGQVVIAVLIQLGGMGVMVFATVIGIVVLRRVSLAGRLATAAETHSGLAGLGRIVRGIVGISLAVEAIVWVPLTLRFWLGYGEPFGHAAWLGLFHAVSSFNNAGFALFSDNLVGFVDDPWICLPLAVATILGGLGFPVIVQLLKAWRTPRSWAVQTWLVLTATGGLLMIGTVAITVLEWSNPATLGGLDPASRVLTGFFHSVQTRTAGFNAVDIGQLHPATLLVMDVLMFIGGGSAGTAGGIKVTTFGVLLAIVVAEVRGDGTVRMFGKRISRAVHREAISVVLLSVALVVAGTLVLLLTTPFTLDAVLFESVSAFGTVGLSTGITADVGVAGQLTLVLLMFAGRVGPITVASALALRRRRILFDPPKERPVIG